MGFCVNKQLAQPRSCLLLTLEVSAFFLPRVSRAFPEKTHDGPPG